MDQTWVLIPNHNGKHWLGDCLDSIRQTMPSDTQVVLLDNASTDDSRDWVIKHYPRVQVVALPMNLGFVDATNLGIVMARAAGARATLLLNNDTRLCRGWYDQLLRVARDYPMCGILSPMQLDFTGVPSPRTKAILRTWSKRTGLPAEGKFVPDLIASKWIEGSCMWVRREVFEKIGYLDPLFSPAYFEEVDFCRRARRHGIGVGLVTRSAICHYGAGSSASPPRQSWRRSIIERNHLLYRASRPKRGLVRPARTLAARFVRHGAKKLLKGELTPLELVCVLAGLPGRVRALYAKVERDFHRKPCPWAGSGLPLDAGRRVMAQWIESLAPHANSPQESAA